MSGMNFPLSKLFSTVPGAIGGMVTLVSAAIPVSFGLDGLRQLLFPGQIVGVLPPFVEMSILLGMGVVFVAAAYVLLKRMEWLAKVEARLSLRWVIVRIEVLRLGHSVSKQRKSWVPSRHSAALFMITSSSLQ